MYFYKEEKKLSLDRPYRPSLTDMTHRLSLGGVTVLSWSLGLPNLIIRFAAIWKLKKKGGGGKINIWYFIFSQNSAISPTNETSFATHIFC